MQVRLGDLGPDAVPGSEGYVTATRVGDEWAFLAMVGRGLPPDDIEEFVVWADEVVSRMVQYGPAVDGWRPGRDGGWQWWARRHQRFTG